MLLLDEPLSNLDAQLRVSTRGEIRRVQEETGVTTLHVTHDQGEALALGHRVAVLRDGRAGAARDAGRGVGAAGEHVGGALRGDAADEPRSPA